MRPAPADMRLIVLRRCAGRVLVFGGCLPGTVLGPRVKKNGRGTKVTFFLDWFHLVLAISGGLTITMVQGVYAPAKLIRSTFGVDVDHPVLIMIIRSWCALITLIGILLLWSINAPDLRVPVILIAGISKIFYVALLLTLPKDYRLPKAQTVIYADSAMAVLFAIYLGLRIL